MKAKPEQVPNEGQGETVAGANAIPPAGADASPVAPGDRIAELEGRIVSLEDSLLRSKADFQNLQKRAARERSEAVVYGNAELMRSLLATLDDFERSMKASESGSDPASVLQGVKLTYDNLRKTLADQGLEEIVAIGRPFDPSVHEALMHQPTNEHAPGTVMDVVARGYRLRDRVVRPAKVVVAKAREAVPADSNAEAVETGGGA